MATSESEVFTRAEKLVATTVYQGIEVRMTGDKTLVGLKIPPEVIGRGDVEELGEALREGYRRARIAADYQAGRFVNRATGVQEILDQAPELPEGTEREAQLAPVPELNAGIYYFLARRSWTLADLAQRSELDPQILEDLMSAQYPPFEALQGKKRLWKVMDLALPIARAFGVSPLELWHRGRAKMAADRRASRNLLKRVAKGFLLHLKRRRPGKRKPLTNLRLGTLRDSGVMCEIELGVRIQEENLIQYRNTRSKWMHWKNRRKWKDDKDFGCLLGPGGEILRDLVNREQFTRLADLDQQAAVDPGSITDEELEWVRELVGIPTLEVADTGKIES